VVEQECMFVNCSYMTTTARWGHLRLYALSYSKQCILYSHRRRWASVRAVSTNRAELSVEWRAIVTLARSCLDTSVQSNTFNCILTVAVYHEIC